MLTYVARRFFEAIPLLWIVVTLSFIMVRVAPGGPFDEEKSLPPETQAALETFYGLSEPLYTQYFRYLDNVVFHWDLGPSFKYPGWTVNELILDKLPVSFELGFYSIVFAVVGGVFVGVISSLKPNSTRDYTLMGASLAGICLPNFVIGPLFILIFGLTLGWVNASGWDTFPDKIFPVITLGMFYLAYISRLTRGSMLEVMNQGFIRTARAKGLSEKRVVLAHALRNGLNPVISYLGPALAGVISGSFVVETIFHIPGIGRFFVMAAFNRDYTLVLGTVICFAALIVVFNLLTDIVLVLLNPKQSFS
ncbi:MAG: ABC transporter [Verrucomicrobia bacterium CG_4_10_14_3_um_filter_43_23]|nr:MAG: ABC transporter [Verrucomicrobia bacterium CG1_02_43_26]PIP59184.1 MAG: ABC transporter [Verrucomicrobia bacterium CG22_combo_CG10-13_8_21_14_all_43_17]PIX58460.1 MAG: ABC transporter [Verrucomicrobia bacterium CG_4_10_14_3_um_filter_43_23]PIY63184.1 MAG: ABC transporter [Verrucomicrobia bacterium CG_4_10_14_0_8_um_filter_43_34]PJA44903.1 MAG: ABC transporter [Verrucomicrobia bacterium CG_4_9_14_3_um_filter_43_20]